MTPENDQERIDLLREVVAELAQPDFTPPPHTEEQLVLPLWS